jgi:putative ABC transport system substrate-binding protein
MRRRAFIKVVAGSAITWPLAARGQQTEQVRRIAVLMNRAADDPDGQARLAAFKQALQQLGWTDGGNMRIDTRWGEDDVDRERKYAAELVALAPDVILASGTLSAAPLKRLSRTLPIVFVGVVDPVGGGIVDSLARTGGNATGFLIFEYSLGGKWLDLLKEIAPSVTRVAVLRDPDIPSGTAMFGVIHSAGQPLGLEVSPISMRTPAKLKATSRPSPALMAA